MWSDVKRCEMGCSTSRVAWWRFQVILIRTYRGKWQFGQPHGHGVLRPGVPGVPGVPEMTSEQKGQGHFEKDIARHYGNITPKLGQRLRRTKVTKLLGLERLEWLECLECLEWEFRFRFTVIHQVVSGHEFSGSQRAGIWHLDLQRSVPRGAQDGTAPAPAVLESCRSCRICRICVRKEWK